MSDTSGPGGGSGNHDRRGRLVTGNDIATVRMAKRARGLTRYLAEAMKDGEEVGEIMVRIARNDEHPSQYKAAEWIGVRLFGKPKETVEVTGAGGKPLNPLSGVDVADLLALAKAQGSGK